MVRASASGAVDLGLIPSRLPPMTLKLVFTASRLDAQHLTNDVENKPASLLVMPLGKAHSVIPPLWCGRQDGRQFHSELVLCIDRFLVILE